MFTHLSPSMFLSAWISRRIFHCPKLEVLWSDAFKGYVVLFSPFPLHSGEQKLSHGAKIRWLGRLDKQCHAIFSLKLPRNQGGMHRCIAAMRPLLSTLSQVGVFLSQCVSQMLQIFQVKRLVNSLTKGDKFCVDDSFRIDVRNQHYHDAIFWCCSDIECFDCLNCCFVSWS